jgi:RNA polymerase primary sigma factor
MSESSNQSSLSIYFSEVDGGDLLTREEEQQLAQTMDLARQKDKNGKRSTEQLWREDVDPGVLRRAKRAREKLITSNLRLVASVAKNFQGKGCELADLIQEGNIGLMDGIDRFDWEKKLKISTYCTWWIRQRIDRLISNHGRTVRVPVHVQTLIGKVKKATESYIEEHGNTPSVEFLSEKLGETTDMVRAAIEHMNPNSTITLDHSPGSGSEETEKTLHSYLKDDNASSPLDAISHKELVLGIRNVIKTLNPRDEKILRLRFGIVEDPKDHNSWPIIEEEMRILEERAKNEQ